ncbi:MAG TPA: glycosyltransferase [Acidimicrobiia bacterium]|nr:glycosyltransferase [Acidimicrobiia bacterium]
MTSRRPIVVVAIKGLGIGGAERLIAEGARFWDRSAFNYRVAYALPWKDHLVPQLAALDVPVELIGTRSGLTPLAMTRLAKTLRSADLVHAHLPVVGIAARLMVGRTPLVYTEHNLVSSYRPLTRFLNRLTYGRNSATVAVSDQVAKALARYPGPVLTISNGVSVQVDATDSLRARTALGLSESQPLVVHVGNIRPGKGHHNLLSAAKIIVSERPDVVVISLGAEKHRGDLDRLRELVRRKGLDENVRFLGQVPNALHFIAAATLFVNPSSIEGLPVALLEAMALGRPVVATAAGGVPQIVLDGETGWLVPAGDPEALAAAALRMLGEPEEAQRMAKAGAELIHQEFGLERMVRSYEALYRQILER